MHNSRTTVLLGSSFVFVFLASLLFVRYPWAVAAYPFYSLIFLWTDYQGDDEIHVIFIYLAIVMAAMLIYAAPDGALQAAFAIEMVGIIGVSWGLSLHRNSLAAHRHSVLGEVQELQGRITDLDRELELYSSYGTTASTQIQLRKDLTEAAKSLGTTLDQKEVQARLVRILEKRYSGSHIRIDPGQASDPLIAWTITNRNSVLVRDVRADERFTGLAGYHFRSAIVTPLMVMKRPFAFLRIENPQPGVFKAEDARTVDLFATLAALTLENIQFFENVNDLATHDALTQLFTRRAFDSRLQEEILRASRGRMPVSLIMGDVDHFKHYNDTFGHQAGDVLLRTLAGILVQYARPVDFVARYGGEEFCMILPGYAAAQAAECAELIRTKVAEEPFMFQNRRNRVTISFGVASFPDDAAAPHQLVRAADERLYKAKQGGRNQVVAS